MSWLSRKLTDSDWSYPVDFQAYFKQKTIQQNMDKWYQQKLLEEQNRERHEIWNEYMKNKEKKNG